MAGPGGGAPRKSHTKSRKGCRTCKKRHIRCDELFPQCRNCTKHSVRCDYMDMPAAGEEPLKGSKPPDLLMSPELQRTLDNWRLTGEPPLQELRCEDPHYWTRFSTIDLRLIHHITVLSLDLHRRGYSACTPWAPKILILINVALSSDFAMSALLAFSASHLAWQTKNADTENLAYHHRGVAFKGLHEAIGAFSERNSEAILAASMLLSWQATEWRSWASLQQGLSTVMNAMRQWFHKSELANYLEGQRSMARARTPSTPSITGHPLPTPPEDLRRVDQISTALHNLRLRLANDEELGSHLDSLINYLQQLRRDFPLRSPDEAFERMQPLRSLLFWLPPALLRPGESDLGAIAMLCHFYALALVLEPLYPEIGGAYLGNMSVGPIESMHEMLQMRKSNMAQDNGLQVAMSLAEIPMQIAASYKNSKRYMVQAPDLYRHSPQPSPFISPHHHLASTPDVPASSVYSNSPMQSPRGLQIPGTSYFTVVPGPAQPRDSSVTRPGLERSMNAEIPLSHVPYVPSDHSQHSHPSIVAGMDYFTQSAYPPGQPFGAAQSRKFDMAAPSRIQNQFSRTNTSASVPSQHGPYPYQSNEDLAPPDGSKSAGW